MVSDIMLLSMRFFHKFVIFLRKNLLCMHTVYEKDKVRLV
jgi:hypothetical protein